MKPYQIAMGLALLGAAGLLLFGDSTPSSEVAEAVVRPGRAGAPVAARAANASNASNIGNIGNVSNAARDAKPAADVMILRLVPRAMLVGESGEATFASGEGVFLPQNWNPPPPPPPPASVSNAPPPAPVAPPLPFVLIGKAVADGAWEVYLSRGDKTYVVRAQTVIDGVYRVDSIVPPLMSLTYLPLNQVQQLNIGVLD